MYNDQLFLEGIHSVLIAQWQLRCETPLAIRNGETIGYTDTAAKKTRGQGLRLLWSSPINQDHEVAALHYEYVVEQDQVKARHIVPASSIRGALRSWTIAQLVHPDFLSNLMPPPSDDEDQTERYIQTLLAALQQRSNGYELIASLFGLAANTRSTRQVPSNAGRLWVETEFVTDGEIRTVDASGATMVVDSGPTNAKRQMTVRNPLDRMTHASKDKGLHHFLEFCRGQEFKVRLLIRNPQASDIGLLGVWKQEIEWGLLRIGALTSIGRGRLSIKGESYHLWGRPNTSPLNGIEPMTLTPVMTSEDNSDDVLSGFWSCATIAPTSLPQFRRYLVEYV